MADQKGDEGEVAVLIRMLAYVREEAVRLRIMDVAILLEHAEEAVAAFAPATRGDQGLGSRDPAGNRVEH